MRENRSSFRFSPFVFRENCNLVYRKELHEKEDEMFTVLAYAELLAIAFYIASKFDREER